MNNNRTKHAFGAAGASFALCVLAMLAGGLTWFTGAAGWLVFFSIALAVVVGVLALEYLTKIDRIEWKAEQASVYERMEDAQKCIAVEERNHANTKRELTDVRQQLNKERAATQHAQTEFNNMSDRASQRAAQVKDLQSQLDELMGLNMKEATRHAETMQNLHDKVQADNDTWRKQVSAMRTAASNLCRALDVGPDPMNEQETQDWIADLKDGLQALADSGGVPVADDRQLVIPVETVSVEEYLTPAQELDKAQVIAFEHVAMPGKLAERDIPEPISAERWEDGKRLALAPRGIDAPLPPAQVQPSPLHEVNRLIDEVKEKQSTRRARLDGILKAIENGYELSPHFEAANLRGPAHVTDTLINTEWASVEVWTAGERHKENGWHK